MKREAIAMRNRGRRSVILGTLTACGLLLSACFEEETAAGPPPIRAIKHMALEQGVAAQQRRIAGVVAAGTTSVASFETAGKITQLNLNIGDKFSAGDVLAKLDPEPFTLRLEEANGLIGQADASLADASSKYKQQKQLFDKGLATRTAHESALAALRTARGALDVAKSQMHVAERNLQKTKLKAPFDGVVARRAIEVFEEVASGQEIYTLQTEGENEIKVSLPETLVNVVSVGDDVQVVVSLPEETTILGRVAEISPLAESVNAYPVTVGLLTSPDGMRPGMSAQVLFEFKPADTSDAFSIPISALKPAVDEQGGHVYVFDGGTLRERAVQVVNLRDNALQIVGDIKPGEVIATAGVSLLHDGMQVRLFDRKALQ